MKDESFEKLVDFLLGNEENAKIICSFIDDLTDKGFEYYIADYYKKIHGFTTAVNGGFNDKGIDVKGLRIDEKGDRENLIVQCKKWNWGPKGVKDRYYIGENKISEWYGKVADHKVKCNVRLVFVTTKDVIERGVVFCRDKSIDLITFKELVDFNKKMDLKEWIESTLESSITQIKKEKLISKEYIERRKRFLDERKVITQKTIYDVAIEKGRTVDYDRYANFDKTKTHIKNFENLKRMQDVEIEKSKIAYYSRYAIFDKTKTHIKHSQNPTNNSDYRIYKQIKKQRFYLMFGCLCLVIGIYMMKMFFGLFIPKLQSPTYIPHDSGPTQDTRITNAIRLNTENVTIPVKRKNIQKTIH